MNKVTPALFARYPRMNDFLNVRQAFDPDRVFLNPFLENEVFQLPAHTSPAAQVAPARPRPRVVTPAPGPDA